MQIEIHYTVHPHPEDLLLLTMKPPKIIGTTKIRTERLSQINYELL